MTRVILKIPQILKLHTFYESLGKAAISFSRREIAEKAKAVLKFDVTESNIDAIEKGLGSKRNCNSNGGDVDLALIVNHMIKLMEAVGYEVPEDLRSLLTP